jgi:cytochrome c556
MTRKFAAAAVAISVGGAIALHALAQTNPNQLINNRKGAMNLQAKYFGPILAMAQGRAAYDAKAVQRNADYLAVLSQLPWDDFQAHSLGLDNTRAKPEVEKDAAKFKQNIERLQSEIQKLQATARAGDENGVKAMAPDIARTCNGCHEDFSTFKFRFKI